jgi:hypothetical protein
MWRIDNPRIIRETPEAYTASTVSKNLPAGVPLVVMTLGRFLPWSLVNQLLSICAYMEIFFCVQVIFYTIFQFYSKGYQENNKISVNLQIK